MKRFWLILVSLLFCAAAVAQVDLPYFSSFETAAERADWYFDDYGGANWHFKKGDSLAYTGNRFLRSGMPGRRSKYSDHPISAEVIGQQETNRLFSPLFFLPIVKDSTSQQILLSVYLAASLFDDEAASPDQSTAFKLYALVDNTRTKLLLDTTVLFVSDGWTAFQFDVSEFSGITFQLVVEHLPLGNALLHLDDFGLSSIGIEKCRQPVVNEYPYEEGFENGMSCWQSTTWEMMVGYGDYSNMAVASWGYDDDDRPVAHDNWLFSPRFALPQADAISFSWQEMGSNSTSYSLFVASHGDSLFMLPDAQYDFDTVHEWYVSRSVDLSQYAGDTVSLAFRHAGKGGNIVIDDIALRTTNDYYTVRYFPGEAPSDNSSIPLPLIRYPDSYIVEACPFQYPGHRFICWEPSPYMGVDYLPAGSVIDSLDKNLTLVAVWQPIDTSLQSVDDTIVPIDMLAAWIDSILAHAYDTLVKTKSFMVHFEPQGAVGYMPDAVVSNAQSLFVVPFPQYQVSDSIFVGWNTAPNASGEWLFVDSVLALSNDITLYASWQPLQSLFVGLDSSLLDTVAIDVVDTAVHQSVVRLRDTLPLMQELDYQSSLDLVQSAYTTVGDTVDSFVVSSVLLNQQKVFQVQMLQEKYGLFNYFFVQRPVSNDTIALDSILLVQQDTIVLDTNRLVQQDTVALIQTTKRRDSLPVMQVLPLTNLLAMVQIIATPADTVEYIAIDTNVINKQKVFQYQLQQKKLSMTAEASASICHYDASTLMLEVITYSPSRVKIFDKYGRVVYSKTTVSTSSVFSSVFHLDFLDKGRYMVQVLHQDNQISVYRLEL